MKLVLYSGGDRHENEQLDTCLLELAGSRRRKPSITFIPASSDGGAAYFEYFRNYFGYYGVRKFNYLPVDVPYSVSLLEKAFNADVVYLSGGNTFYFLKHLRKTGLLEKLSGFAASGGVLSGVSAGSIVMTPHIRIAGPVSGLANHDPNEVKLVNMKAMGLVDFEFCPHFEPSRQNISLMKKYSGSARHPVFACGDGSGIVISDNKTVFVGHVLSFVGGKNFLIGDPRKSG